MKTSGSTLIGISSLTLLLGAYQVDAAPPAKKAAPVKYAKVAQIFQKNCVRCHNSTRAAAKVDLTNFAAIMKGGGHGPIVVPKNPMKSDLLLYVNGTKSPRMPMRSAPLPAGDIALIKTWIAQGAKP